MDLTDLLAATKDVNAAITQIDQKLRKPEPSSAPAPPVVEQATTDDSEELGDVAHVSRNGYVASCRCLAVVRPSNSVELVDLDGGASTVLMEAPSQAAVAASALSGGEVLVVAAWGDACARWRLTRDGAGGWRVAVPRQTCAGLAAVGTILVAASNTYISRCAGTAVDVLDNDSLTLVSHFSVGGAGRALAWGFAGGWLAVAGAGGLTIWGGASGPPTETVIPTPCRCVVATLGRGIVEDDAFVCVADAGLLTREEARADDMKARASDGYVGRAETRDTGFGGGLIPAGLLVGGCAAAPAPETPRPTASLVMWDGQWHVAATARIDALPRGVAVVDAVAAVGDDVIAVASSFDPQRAVAVFAARDLAPRPAVRIGGGDGRVRALAADGGRLAAVVVARAGAPPLCAAGARGPAPGAARRVVVDLAPPPAPAPPAPPAPPAAPSSVTDRLATLAHLRASGALTDAEFARAKALELGLPAP